VARRSGLRALLLNRMTGSQRQRAARVRGAGHELDWARTRAYMMRTSFPAGAIQVNLRGRQPHGIVEPGPEYERVRDEVIAGLRGLTLRGGERPIREVYRREELYSGPHLERAPDIVFLTSPDFTLGDRSDALVHRLDAVAAAAGRMVHRLEGIVSFTGRGVFRQGAALEGANILDVAPTLLYALGLPVPNDMDGRVLEAAFEPTFLQREALVAGDRGAESRGAPVEYSAEEEEGIRAALRGLGYIE
jgi:predicted AlkP superfamily phosphohydrolase/phosphomutase